MKKEFDEILQDADLFNDMYASVFFEEEVDTLQLMLSLIRGKEIIIDSVEIQLTIVNTDSKSTRMDVVGHEADESVDIVEFQVIHVLCIGLHAYFLRQHIVSRISLADLYNISFFTQFFFILQQYDFHILLSFLSLPVHLPAAIFHRFPAYCPPFSSKLRLPQ